jgi:pimeloyl-ACP methyl ester carboxylesterase
MLPEPARATVLFAHGSGSSRQSPRNRAVAAELRLAALGTLLIDLLTEEEERQDLMTAEHRFDIALLGRRLEAAMDWLDSRPATRDLPLVLFGASTGAAAALLAAAERPDRVLTVVSRGGRPVLLIVGGDDHEVLRLNEEAARRLRTAHAVRVIPGATHLFQEPGALEQVAEAAREWCEERLRTAPA